MKKMLMLSILIFSFAAFAQGANYVGVNASGSPCSFSVNLNNDTYFYSIDGLDLSMGLQKPAIQDDGSGLYESSEGTVQLWLNTDGIASQAKISRGGQQKSCNQLVKQ